MWWEENVLGAWNMVNEVFDTLSEEEKKELFLNTIETIEQDEDFQNLKKYRDNMDEDKKLKYYYEGNISGVNWSAKWYTTWPLTPKFSKNSLKIRIDVKDNIYTMASPLMRLWVSFWLLDAPKSLPEKELLKNIKKDARRLRKNLWIFEKVCAVVPQLKATYPFIKMVRPYAKRYEKYWVKLMQDRVKQKMLETTEKNIATALTSQEENIEREELLRDNAA